MAAPRLDWSSSKLPRIENGRQAIDVHGVRSMLDLYDGAARWRVGSWRGGVDRL